MSLFIILQPTACKKTDKYDTSHDSDTKALDWLLLTAKYVLKLAGFPVSASLQTHST